MNLLEQWNELISDPWGIVDIIAVGGGILALAAKGIYELVKLIKWRIRDRRAYMRRWQALEYSAPRRSASQSPQTHTQAVTAIDEKPEALSDEQMAAKSAFEVLRNSDEWYGVHEMIYFLFEVFDEAIDEEDTEWGNETLDGIHLEWVDQARHGDHIAFKKLCELQGDGRWPEESRESLPSDWDDIVSTFSNSNAPV